MFRITYTKAKYKMLYKMTFQALQLRQVAWIHQFLAYHRKGYEFIYIDETSTHLWDNRGNVWQSRYQPLRIVKNSDRGKSITIFGAISSLGGQEQKVHYSLAKSTNTVDFIAFLRHRVIPNFKRP